MKKVIIAIALTSMAFTAYAGGVMAPTIPATQTKKTENKFYAGLNWTLGGSALPQFVVGFRNGKIKSDGKTYGSDISMGIALDKPGPGKFKVKYFGGDNNLQGDVGLGYDFQGGKFLGSVGAQGSHITGGLDYVFGSGLEPYLGINTIDEYNAPAVTCPSGFILVGSTCFQEGQG